MNPTAYEISQSMPQAKTFENAGARDVEIRLLELVTEGLLEAKAAQFQFDPLTVSRNRAAIEHNLDVWKVFAIDIADENNRLPKELKVLISNLATYVGVNSGWILAGHGGGDLEMLILINQNIMEGLRGIAAP